MPRSISSQDVSRIQFAYYTYVTSPIGDVFQYLLRSTAHSNAQGKRMGLAAISAFWKPFSAQAVLKLSKQEVKAAALASIDELEQQIELIRTTFDVPKRLSDMTRREIEDMIEESLTQRLTRRERIVQNLPVPDNYNTHQ